MARRKRRATRRRGYSTVLKKRSKCPSSIRRECKTTKKGGQRCRIVAGSWHSKYMPAGKAQRSALNLKAKLLKTKGCSPALATKLAGYRRRRSRR